MNRSAHDDLPRLSPRGLVRALQQLREFERLCRPMPCDCGQGPRQIAAGTVELEPGEQGAGRDPLGDAARRAGVSREQYATAVLDVQAAFRRAEALELEDGPSGLDDWLRYNARAGR